MHTQRGIFGASGNGGGIFATTVQGLGAVDPFAAVPAACWNSQAFKDCSAAANKTVNDTMYRLKNDGAITYEPGSQTWGDAFHTGWAGELKACVSKHCATGSVATTKTTTTSKPAVTTATSIPADAYAAPASFAWGKWLAIAGGAIVAGGIGYLVLKRKS